MQIGSLKIGGVEQAFDAVGKGLAAGIQQQEKQQKEPQLAASRFCRSQRVAAR